MNKKETTKMILTNEQANLLDKIAWRTKCDCWFWLDDVSENNEGDYEVFDLEEDKYFDTPMEGILTLMEAIYDKECFDYCYLSDDEKKCLAQFLKDHRIDYSPVINYCEE